MVFADSYAYDETICYPNPKNCNNGILRVTETRNTSGSYYPQMDSHNRDKVFCFLSSLPLPPPQQPLQCLAPTCYLSTVH